MFSEDVLVLDLAWDSLWYITHWAGLPEIFWRHGDGSAGHLWCCYMNGGDRTSNGYKSVCKEVEEMMAPSHPEDFAGN